jgi:3-dehydroquinate dehydratase
MGLGPGGDWTRLHAPIMGQSLVYATMRTEYALKDEGRINVRDVRDAWQLLEY